MHMIFKSMLFSAASITLTAGLVAFADPSVASVPQTSATQIRVVYADLDMGTAAGRLALDQRIRSAATRVCATGDASEMFQGASCRRQAIQSAHRALPVSLAADARTAAVQVAAN